LEPYHRSFDKGKPVERRGRKAKGLKSRPRDHDSLVAEAKYSLGFLSVFVEEERKMTLKNRNISTILNAGLFLAIFISLLFNPSSALAMGNNATLPSFAEFSESVQNGDATALRGVYVPHVIALPIVQQPYGNAGYVSNNDGETTQFRMASEYGNIGLLAHNHLSGKTFSQLAVGQEIRLVYGDGRVEYFTVTEVLRYQALEPNSPYSSFRNLDKDETLSADGMFKRVYFGDRHITFQTCIEKDGELSWGRLFVIVTPSPESTATNRPAAQ
jgi:hypothetical protein